MEISRLIGIWNTMPGAFRQVLLAKIWCPACRDFSTMADFSCTAADGEFRVEGRCRQCGQKISRPLPLL